MITASIVLFKTKIDEIDRVINCSINSFIDRIFIIDNSPTSDLYGEVIKHSSPKLFYTWGHGNIGYGAGHNMAIAKAVKLGAKYHIVLNPDIYFEKGTVEDLTKFMDEYPEAGLILPKVVYPNGELQYLCKLLPTPFDILGRRLFPKSWGKKRKSRYEMHSTGYNKIRNCPILSGCFMFMRMDVIKKVGGFDERFFMYFEDYDLNRRIHQVSKTIYYPYVTIVHAHAAEHRSNNVLLKISIRSAILYFNKWGWIFDKERKYINQAAFDDENIVEF